MLGSGAASDPYLIATSADLQAIASAPAAHYRLTADIALTGLWTPLPYFTGELDGDGYEITGLEVNLAVAGNAGLFRSCGGSAYIHDLIVRTSTAGIYGATGSYVGVLVGNVNAGATIRRVVAYGRIELNTRAGGLIGRCDVADVAGMRTVVDECAAFVQMTPGTNVRSLIGYSYSGVFVLSCATCAAIAGVTGQQVGSSAVDVAALSTPTAQAEYYQAWDFDGAWEMRADGPALRKPVIETNVVRYSRVPAGITSVDARVSVEGQPARRAVIAVTRDTYLVAGVTRQAVQPVVVGYGRTGVDGAVTLDLDGYAGDVYLIALDDWPAPWQADVELSIGDLLRPAGAFAGVAYECIAAGNSGTVEPAWWPYSESDNARAVGTATFMARRYLRPLAHGPLSASVS